MTNPRPDAAPPDLVLVGGRVFTADPRRAFASGVAVRDGRITAVADEDSVRRMAGPRTRLVELAERLVVPGFIDAHVHPAGSGVAKRRCALHGLSGLQAYLAEIRAYAERHPDLDWIVGSGWALADFPRGTPSRIDLDAIVPDRPCFIENRDGHGAWVNSRALEMAGVDRDTPDPSDGRIERDPAGEPSGTLHEGAMDLVERLIPPITQAEYEDGLLTAQGELHALGITGWQEAWVTPEIEAAYLALASRGQLTGRVVGALWWDRDRGEEQIPGLLDRRAGSHLGRFRATSVKIMQDGIMENFTAGLTAPYLDGNGAPTGNSGLSQVDPEALARYVSVLDREGFQVHVHAIGDRAVREALDAFELTRRENGTRDQRHHIAHIQLVHPDDVPRFGQLGVVANAQAYWAVYDPQMTELTIPFLGPERTGWQYPFGSLLRSGARLAMGSDWDVTTADPLAQIEVAVTRILPADRGQAPFLPEEAIGLADALTAFTLGSAFVNHADAETGSLEVGKLADLAVIDRDLFAADGPIGDARVLLTLVEGDAVYEAPGLD